MSEPEPKIYRMSGGNPCVAWVRWYREEKDCTLREAFDAGLSKLEEKESLQQRYDALAAQRDEGLAREAELRSEVERWQGIATYRAKERSDFIEKINRLSQSVAESVVLIDRALPLVGEPYYSWMADAGVFVATHGHGCADGEKAE